MDDLITKCGQNFSRKGLANINGWMDRCMDGWMDGLSDACMDGCIDHFKLHSIGFTEFFESTYFVMTPT
jgi:hypothetical protein